MYDLVIIGAGPAGLGASIYASRYKLNHLVLGAEVGGQVVEAWEIENYAGIESISGKDLMEKFKKQTIDLGGTIVSATVTKISKNYDGFEIITDDGKKREAKSVILALGMKPRKLNIPNEDKFIGKGISYCATCDAMFSRGKDVVVIGGGDSAATAALHLAEFVNSVQLLFKDGTKVFEPAWEQRMAETGKIAVASFEKIDEILGSESVAGIVYETKDGKKKELKVQGIFIEIGSTPGVMLAKDLGVETDEQNYIVVKQDQSTNIENVYAAGDVTTGSNKFRQIITAVAEGAVAAGSVYKKLKLVKK
ncbi:MAG TPA: FAD-dependent oxidoreductase [Candidatus Moranbacteria bacterium]|jgi:thioredoxin reductase (NADPH)|nr:FAD-dependent oxidoreductase [Candidatus Moranbacteria bacterium]HOF42281.1 FAD-dependent oxidoreductase [Candidatus Moranbacteria bacterium]HPX93995.1 FAD-dependent oxidoreductase [Candidatus Moranbacteria bacterium]HQB59278.1 FAD-dependent oxidoreductase [Candidatus Moranbacteria bacterium]